MSVKSSIIDPKIGKFAEINIQKNEPNALVVGTREIKTFENIVRPFLNPTKGIAMNQDASFGGTPENVHDGTDNVYWTASAISGTWDFASTDQNHTAGGSKSIDGIATQNNDTAQFTIPSGDLSVGSYVAITGWIYITTWASLGEKDVNIFGWDTGTGLQIGDAVNLSDYIRSGEQNVWQKFSIPLSDMNLISGTIDALRITTINVPPGAAPDYYLDDIQFEETGGALEYKVEPSVATWLHVKRIHLIVEDVFDPTLADSTIPKIPFNQFLGVSRLTNGIKFERVNNDKRTTNIFRDIADFAFNPAFADPIYSTDGTNTWAIFKADYLAFPILKYENEDFISITIQDDLSGLVKFQAAIWAKEESRK